MPGKAYIGMVSIFVGARGPVVATACGVIDAVVAGFAAERRIRRLAFATGFFPTVTGKVVHAAAGLIVNAVTVSEKANRLPRIFGATSIIEAFVVASVVARKLVAANVVGTAATGVAPLDDFVTLFFRRHLLVAAVGRTGKVEEEAAELIGATVAIYVHAFVKVLVQVQHLKVVVVVKVTVVGRLIGHLKGGRVVQHAKIIV